ncbi:MAG: hypothetical protein M3R46_09725 [Actinomycetota bacterium]|nr:hypothetical protein [Actinomycetota bacterium]
MLLEGEPERYGAWAARWAARFVHEAAGADVDEAAFVLAALIALRGRSRSYASSAARSGAHRGDLAPGAVARLAPR